MPAEEREVRGTVSVDGKAISVIEMRDAMRLTLNYEKTDLSAANARVLARALYRVAGRLERRVKVLNAATLPPDAEAAAARAMEEK